MIWLTVLGGYAVLLLIGQHIERSLCAKWDRDRHLAEREQWLQNGIAAREVAVRERTITLEEQKITRLAQGMKSDPMPPELVERVMTWEDDWAQDQERARIMDLYGIYQNWDDVQKHLPAMLT